MRKIPFLCLAHRLNSKITKTIFAEQYIWLIWSSAFLLPWIFIFIAFPSHRKAMWCASLFNTPLGLSEPPFVPEYWSPPSLFDLAITTGFDIESLIFCFGIGGIGAVLYNLVTRKSVQPISAEENRLPLHRHHYKALATPLVVFPVLYVLPWNPIYPGIVAMFARTAANVLCRPDLRKKTWVGGVLFLGYYTIFLMGWNGRRRVTLTEYGTWQICQAFRWYSCPWKSSCLPSLLGCTGRVSMSTSPG